MTCGRTGQVFFLNVGFCVFTVFFDDLQRFGVWISLTKDVPNFVLLVPDFCHPNLFDRIGIAAATTEKKKPKPKIPIACCISVCKHTEKGAPKLLRQDATCQIQR